MDDLENLSDSVEGDLNNLFTKASSVDEFPVIEGSDDFFEVADLNPPGVGAGGGGSSGSNPNGDKNGGGGFSITVNGSAPVIGPDGLPVYASTVSLDCNPGHVILLAGGSAATANQIDHSGSFSASFPIANENAFFAVYGQVTYGTTTSEKRVTPSGDPISPGTAPSKIVIDTSANAATNFKDGWSRASDFDTTNNLVYMFPIGVVCLQKDGNNRRVFVNQIQSGNKNINFSTNTVGSGSDAVDIGDGFRQITFCINGDPFTGFIDIRGIAQVT